MSFLVFAWKYSPPPGWRDTGQLSVEVSFIIKADHVDNRIGFAQFCCDFYRIASACFLTVCQQIDDVFPVVVQLVKRVFASCGAFAIGVHPVGPMPFKELRKLCSSYVWKPYTPLIALQDCTFPEFLLFPSEPKTLMSTFAFSSLEPNLNASFLASSYFETPPIFLAMPPLASSIIATLGASSATVTSCFFSAAKQANQD